MFEPMMHWKVAAESTAIVLAHSLSGSSRLVISTELQEIVHLKTNVLSSLLSDRIRNLNGNWIIEKSY